MIVQVFLLAMHVAAKLEPIPKSELPEDFDYPEISGETPLKTPILLTQYIITQSPIKKNYLMLFDWKGNLLWYKKTRSSTSGVFRNKQGHLRFLYRKPIKEPSHPIESYDLTEYMQEIDIVRGQEHGDISVYYPIAHDYFYIDDGHYLLLLHIQISERVEDVIQEIKDNQVVFHWQSNYLSSRGAYQFLSTEGDNCHGNAIAIDPKDSNILLSCYKIGLIKIDRESKEIKWVLHRDFGLLDSQKTRLQHSVSVYPDGSIVLFDDSGYS